MSQDGEPPSTLLAKLTTSYGYDKKLKKEEERHRPHQSEDGKKAIFPSHVTESNLYDDPEHQALKLVICYGRLRPK
eukprot:gene20662-7602_t